MYKAAGCAGVGIYTGGAGARARAGASAGAKGMVNASGADRVGGALRGGGGCAIAKGVAKLCVAVGNIRGLGGRSMGAGAGGSDIMGWGRIAAGA
jgi:hypothetical protein